MGCRLQTGAAGPHLLQARPGGGEVLIYPPTNYFVRNHINSSSAAPFGSPPTRPLDKYTTRRLGRGCSQSDIWRPLWYQVQCSPWPDAQRPRTVGPAFTHLKPHCAATQQFTPVVVTDSL